MAPFVLEQSESQVTHAEFSADSRYTLILREDGSLKLWSFDTAALLQSLPDRNAPLKRDQAADL